MFIAVSCGIPDLLANASDLIEPGIFSNHEDSQLKFLCDDEKIIFTCWSNGSWTPNPNNISCSSLELLTGYAISCFSIVKSIM